MKIQYLMVIIVAFWIIMYWQVVLVRDGTGVRVLSISAKKLGAWLDWGNCWSHPCQVTIMLRQISILILQKFWQNIIFYEPLPSPQFFLYAHGQFHYSFMIIIPGQFTSLRAQYGHLLVLYVIQVAVINMASHTPSSKIKMPPNLQRRQSCHQISKGSFSLT